MAKKVRRRLPSARSRSTTTRPQKKVLSPLLLSARLDGTSRSTLKTRENIPLLLTAIFLKEGVGTLANWKATDSSKLCQETINPPVSQESYTLNHGRSISNGYCTWCVIHYSPQFYFPLSRYSTGQVHATLIEHGCDGAW